LLGNGDRTFGAPNELFKVAVNADGLVAGHFVGSPALDLVVLDDRPAGRVVLLRGDGTGGFTAPVAFAAGENPNSITVGDFNRDGRLDVVVTNQSQAVQSGGVFSATDYVSVLLNQGAGGFSTAIRTDVLTVSAASAAALPTLQSPAAVSLNLHVFPDLTLSTTGGINNLVTLEGVGDGSFLTPRLWATTGGGRNVISAVR
jgi:hypothetical protein